MRRTGNQFGRILGKERHAGLGEKRAYEETGASDAHADYEREFKHLQHAVVTLCPVVVARYGLHALVQADNHHHAKEHQAVANAERAH